MPNDERRREPRVRRQDRLTVEWTDASYEAHQVQGRCLDLSTTGMRLQLDALVPAGQYIQFLVAEGGFRGSGTVRFVRREGKGYVAGLKFAWQMKTEAA